MFRWIVVPVALGAATAGVRAQDLRTATPADTATLMAVLAAEDARGAQSGMPTMLAALTHEDDRMRVIAVRAIGRLERPNLVSAIAPLLADDVASVRIAAANAVAQSVFHRNTHLATRTLSTRLELERDALVRAALVAALGRLPFVEPDRIAETESVMLRHSTGSTPDQMREIARGWDAFVRRVIRTHTFSEASGSVLRSLASYRPDPPRIRRDDGSVERTGADVRELGVSALATIGRLDHDRLTAALDDTSWEVRRAAVAALTRMDPVDRPALLGVALRDRHPSVRIEALRVLSRGPADNRPCGMMMDATADSVTHVALTAIEALATGCDDSETDAAADRLIAFVDTPFAPDAWHHAAHALVALASIRGEAARTRLLRFAEDPTWWVRLYAARAATTLEATGVLERLAFDDHDNVRDAAIRGLVRIVGHDADDIVIQNLRRPDYQLLRTLARALEGSEHPDAVPALLQTLFRVTAERKDTSRDPRRALVDRISELGDARYAPALQPYVHDFDPVIATAVADILERWTGNRLEPAPPPRRRTFPAFADLRRLDGLRVTFHMHNRGSFTIQLLPFEAPTNVVRFVRLALDRHFDRLTFHRVVPNFVIQGGSPNANEYMGDGPYTRDELTHRPHTRGTVGLSTRGRDTADSQIFVNLVDNWRLDHNYTIFAQVIRGIDVVDAILEGDLIDRIEVGR